MSKLRTLLLVGAAVVAMVEPAFAEDAHAAAGGSLDGLAAGLGLGLAAFGGALGQSKVLAAAYDGMSRNPGSSALITKSLILGLVFIESLVIYSLVISFKLSGLF